MNSEEVGEILFSYFNTIEWRIPSFHILEQKRNVRIWSPPFSEPEITSYRPFFLHNLPTNKSNISKKFVSLLVSSEDKKDFPFIQNDSPFVPPKFVQFGIVNDENVEINRSSGEWELWFGRFTVINFMRLKDFTGQFRLFCEVINETKCDTVNAWSTDKESGNLEELSQNLKDLYIKGLDTDLVFKVKDYEFKAHKLILRSRSPVFNAMFAHELTESNSGIIPIEDCDPAVFEEFLLFVYSGRTEHLSPENVFELYYVADKYQTLGLKKECVHFLQKSLSIETICDVICLSTKHNETELLDLATTFFARNMEEILVTVKWQLFLRENPTEANELSIKALKLGFRKRHF